MNTKVIRNFASVLCYDEPDPWSSGSGIQFLPSADCTLRWTTRGLVDKTMETLWIPVKISTTSLPQNSPTVTRWNSHLLDHIRGATQLPPASRPSFRPASYSGNPRSIYRLGIRYTELRFSWFFSEIIRELFLTPSRFHLSQSATHWGTWEGSERPWCIGKNSSVQAARPEERHEKRKDSWCPGRDVNRGHFWYSTNLKRRWLPEGNTTKSCETTRF